MYKMDVYGHSSLWQLGDLSKNTFALGLSLFVV